MSGKHKSTVDFIGIRSVVLLLNEPLGWRPDSVSLTWGVCRGVRFPTALLSHPLRVNSITCISC